MPLRWGEFVDGYQKQVARNVVTGRILFSQASVLDGAQCSSIVNRGGGGKR